MMYVLHSSFCNMVTIALPAAANAPFVNIGRLENGSNPWNYVERINMEDCRWLFQRNWSLRENINGRRIK